jgi:hypothetical protein
LSPAGRDDKTATVGFDIDYRRRTVLDRVGDGDQPVPPTQGG